ncbi:MAG: site-specific integrase [Caldilineaceae bacterium]|nr:site-specific integrase [Caldilineaceae bacterium]
MQQRISLQTARELHLADCDAQGFTADTLRFYRGRLVLFVAWCDDKEVEFLTDLTHYHVRQYLADMRGRGLYHSAGFARLRI